VPTVEPTAVPTPAPGEGDIKITLSSSTIYTVNNFTTRISANTGNKYLGSFDFYVYFTGGAIQLNTSVGNSGITSGSNISISSVYTSSSYVEVIATSSAQMGSDITLFTVNRIAVSESVSTIQVTPYTLRDTNGNMIGPLLSVSTQVTVLLTITPDPTVEPTIAPTAAPTDIPTAIPTAVPTPTPSETAAPTDVPTMAPGEGELKIAPSTGTIYTGDNFTTTISLNTGDKFLESMDIIIDYPGYGIQPNSSTGNYGVTPADCIVISSVSATSASLEINATASVQPGTDVPLFTISWDASRLVFRYIVV
jgi:hypothetical protein